MSRRPRSGKFNLRKPQFIAPFCAPFSAQFDCQQLLRDAGRSGPAGFRRLVFEGLEQRLTMSVNVSVDAAQVVRSATAQILGINVAYWDSIVDTPQTVQLAAAAGLTMVRFPGGSAADTWHFTDPTTYSGEGTAGTMAELANSLNASSIVTVDYGSGSPQEAAALLAYLDASPSNTTPIGQGEIWNTTSKSWVNTNWQTAGYWASLRAASPLTTDDGLNFLRLGRSASFGIQDFEIGNELYGSWETDYHGQGGDTGAAHDPATYVKFAKQFQTYATNIAANISIGIDTGSPAMGDYNNWTQDVLQQSVSQGLTIGFLSDHLYPQEPGSESDSTLLLDTVSDPAGGNLSDWANRAAAYRTLLQNTLGSAASGVQLLATEFNSVSYNPGKQSTSLVNGLFVADSLGSLLETEYDGALFWDLHNYYDTGQNNSSSLYGWREGGDYGLLGSPTDTALPATGSNVPYPTYFAEQLVSKLVQTGDAVVEASSGNSLLSVYAVEQPGGDMGLLVINKDPNNAQTAQLQFTGFQPGGSVTGWQYGKTQDTAQSQSTTGNSALANVSATLTPSGSGFSYSFPSYSMTVLDLAPAAPVLNLGGTGGNFAATFVQGRGTVPIVNTSGLSVTDASKLTGATIAISNPPDGSAEVLAVSSAALNGTGVTATPGAGSLTLSGSATAAVYQSILQTLTYNDTATSPSLANRTVSFTVTDANSLSSTPVTTALTFAAAHTPSVTSTATQENAQTTSGLVIAPNAQDTGIASYFQITNISGGTLFQNSGTAQITSGSFITLAQGEAGLRFTPTTSSTAQGSFSVQASTVAAAAGLGGSTVQATITVSPVAPSVTVSDSGGVYDGSAYPAVPLVAGLASLEGVPATSTYYAGPTVTSTPLAGAPIGAGTYTVVASFGGSTDYLAAQSNPLTFTISQASLTVAATSQSRNYGAANPTLIGTLVGVVSGDGITASYSTTAGILSHVQAGGYPITATLLDPNNKLANYKVTNVSGTLTISPVPLTITANSPTKAYGAALPTLTASYAGFENGDTPASLTTQPTLSTTATASSAVSGNPYPVGVSGASDPDYNISYVPGTLTVTAAATTINVATSAATLTYGQTVNLTATVAGAPTPSEGTVTFMNGATTLGTQPVSGGTASLSGVLLPAGINVITAKYSDTVGNFAGSSTTLGPGSIIQTVAGNGSNAYSGDGGQATAAALYSPAGVALDGAGDLFIADADNNRIREVNSVSHVITTVAGNGTAGYSGDGGQATAASLNNPTAIALDAAGDLFIADEGNNVIREVNAVSHVITTVAGNGNHGSSGDGGPATAASLYNPAGVASDAAGDVFIADSTNNRIREVNAVSHVITTVAGGGTGGDGGQATAASLNEPTSVALDTAGDLFIADIGDGRVREVNAVTHAITTVAGIGNSNFSGDGGPATAASLGPVTAVAVDAAGDIFIAAQQGVQRIREVNAVTHVINTVAGNGGYSYSGDGGPATAASLGYPGAIALDAAGDLFIADASSNQIHEVTAGSGVDVIRAAPSVAVSIQGGVYKGSAFAAAATVAGVVSGVDTTPAANLEGVSPTFIYYAGSTTANPLSGAPIQAGTYTVVASFGGSADYAAAASNPQAFTISPAPLTVTANAASRLYGAADPPFTATISGFVNSETLATSGVTGSAGLTSTDTALSPPGTYTITAALGTLAAGNYAFTTFNPGTLTINPAPVGYTAGAAAVAMDPAQTLTDGNASPSLSATVTITGGLQSGDTLSFPSQSGINGVYSVGVLTLSGGGTVPLAVVNYQAALQSIRFSSTSSSLATRTLSLVISDGAQIVGTATQQIIVSPPAEITGVYVSGSAWTANFDSSLVAAGVGNPTMPSLGFALQTGTSQLTTLPWNNINTISVQFNENVNVTASRLAAALTWNSATVGTPPGTTVTYNAATDVATFALSGVLSDNTYMLTIPTSSVLDGNGADLDGAFTNHSTTVTGQAFPSGLGSGIDSNADFNFLFNVLPGAAKQGNFVLGSDVTFIRNRLAEGTTDATGTFPFSPYADLTGGNFILGSAVTAARNMLSQGLPSGTRPSPPAAPSDATVPAVSSDAGMQSSAASPMVALPEVAQPAIGLLSITSPTIVQPTATESSVVQPAVTATTVTQTPATQVVLAQSTAVTQEAASVAPVAGASVAAAQVVAAPTTATSAILTPGFATRPVTIAKPVVIGQSVIGLQAAVQPDVAQLSNVQNAAAQNAQDNVAQVAVVQTGTATTGSMRVSAGTQPLQTGAGPTVSLKSRENAVDAAIADFKLADVLETADATYRERLRTPSVWQPV